MQESVVLFEEIDDVSHIRVVDEFPQRIRVLYFEESIQGEMYLDRHQEPVLEYIALMVEGVRHWVESPSSICMGGLGSASIFHKAMRLWGGQTASNLEIRVVENDPRIVTCARRFFRLPKRQAVDEDDFRVFLQKQTDEVNQARFDAVFVDCYSANSIPPHLMTSEFIELVKLSLSEHGVVVFNIWGDEGNSIWKEQMKTIMDSFSSCAFVQCPNDRNLILFASKKILNRPLSPFFVKTSSYPVHMLKPAANAYYPNMLDEAEILTDQNIARVLSEHALGG